MSVICVVVHNTGVLLMGDTKLTGMKNRPTIQKVFKNGSILLGYTGNTMHIADYMFPYFDYKMDLKYYSIFDDVNCILADLEERYNAAKRERKYYDASITVACKIGNKYFSKRYILSDLTDTGFSPTVTINSSNEFQYLFSGNELHQLCFEDICQEKQPSCLLDFVPIFQETLNCGIFYDQTINNIMTYEVIM